MKDSQRSVSVLMGAGKYIKANNERFSTVFATFEGELISISRRIMKDSQLVHGGSGDWFKYIKANNERFSTIVSDILD